MGGICRWCPYYSLFIFHFNVGAHIVRPWVGTFGAVQQALLGQLLHSLPCRRKMLVAALIAFFCEGALFVRDRNRRNSHFVGSTGFVLYKTFLGSAFYVNCAFGFITLFVLLLQCVMHNFKGVSLSAESDKGRCPLDPCHPLKSVDVNFILFAYPR